jgi:tRNA-Thr(GGU) m(6)t(6)A37 methyltransferase TsaA
MKPMNDIHLQPVAWVSNSRKEISDDYWGSVISEIGLAPALPDECFDGISSFSHLEIIFLFDQVEEVLYSGRPREDPEHPRLGIFAQRKKNRPNRIGLTTVKLIKHEGRKLTVAGLDAIDGTPVLDIKPVFEQFRPTEKIIQPPWVDKLMKNYWK